MAFTEGNPSEYTVWTTVPGFDFSRTEIDIKNIGDDVIACLCPTLDTLAIGWYERKVGQNVS